MKNNINLSTTTSVTTTYAGEFAGDYIHAALLSANSLEQGGFTIIPNVKYQHVIKKGATSGMIHDKSCDFNASGSVTLTEKVITPKRIHVNAQLCKDDYRSDWEAAQMGYSAWDNLPTKFSDFILAHVSATVAQQVEQNLWSGDDANDGEFTGIETRLTTDANLPAANEVSGTTVDASNVQAELRKITTAIPNAIYGKEDLKIYASINIVKAYIGALGGYGASGLGANGMNGQGTMWYTDGSLSFDGIPIFMCNGMTANTAICTTTSNLIFATGLQDDMNVVKLIDMEETDGSDNVRVVMKYTAAADYKYASEVVTYGITNSAN